MVNNQDVIDWYSSRWNKTGKWPVTIDTSLTTGRYVWVWETGEEIMYYQQVNPENLLNSARATPWAFSPRIVLQLGQIMQKILSLLG